EAEQVWSRKWSRYRRAESGDLNRRIAAAMNAVRYAASATDRTAALTHDVMVAARWLAGAAHSEDESPEFVHTHLLRDIVGNPFRPVAVDSRWQPSTVLALAGGIYEDRAFDRLPILADALQDAGCENPDILTHLRDDGPHVRGCWALDLILGKE